MIIVLSNVCFSQGFEYKGKVVSTSDIIDTINYIGLIDSIYGIKKYDLYNSELSGDSVRYDNNGFPAMGWVKDYYPNENLLHKGFYTEGKLKMYKNYYPDGQLERSYKSVDDSKSTIEKYYSNGVLKSEVLYYYGSSLKWKDYYPSGKIEYLEEYHKSQEYFILRQSYYKSGKLETNLELIKPKKHLYNSQEYSEAGGIIKSGQLIFSQTLFDYLKIGKWDIYNLSGRLVKEEYYINGKLNNEINY